MTEQERKVYAESHGISEGEFARIKLVALEAAETVLYRYDKNCEKASPREACKIAMAKAAQEAIATDPVMKSFQQTYWKIIGATVVVSVISSAVFSIALVYLGKCI